MGIFTDIAPRTSSHTKATDLDSPESSVRRSPVFARTLVRNANMDGDSISIDEEAGVTAASVSYRGARSRPSYRSGVGSKDESIHTATALVGTGSLDTNTLENEGRSAPRNSTNTQPRELVDSIPRDIDHIIEDQEMTNYGSISRVSYNANASERKSISRRGGSRSSSIVGTLNFMVSSFTMIQILLLRVSVTYASVCCNI